MEEMKRGLKTRHISMIAIGGSIGTGLFMASGAVITQAGPGGALIAYSIIGVMLYFLMTAIGELATFYPVSGSFSAYSSRFIDRSAGFTVGWLYWIIWALVTSVDILTAAKIITYWEVFQNVNPFIWSIIFLVILFLLNAFTVKAFGEAEYWLSFIKVATIIIFLIVGVLVIFGILGGNEPLGLSNFTYKEAPFVNGISGFLGVLLVAGFSFGGTEVVAVTAGESENPKESMPKAIRQVFWRILLFYILAIAVIAAIIPYTDPLLLNKSNTVTQSPFTIVFDRVGIAFAASIINAVILTALISAGNSGLYATSRLLYSLAQHKQAPKFINNLNKNNMPFISLCVTIALIFISIIYATINTDGYYRLLNMLGALVTLVWLMSIISHIRLRMAIKKQGQSATDTLEYKAPLYPLGPIIVIAVIAFLLIGQSFDSIMTLNYPVLIESFLPIILGIIVYFIHKFVTKSKIIKLEDIDLTKHNYDNK
ncbi:MULTISPECIES: amino acid permease [Mammaliicoccus]|uniref:amino acid permease n=1 Tax=Mammaliicoccus TaxID=2803850 RepID=UPI0009941292|nr:MULTISPECIES: amino acid permease [Mammaliicoccus]MBO3062648.1 amino acid permease [Mammaliicoccus fleurettii]MBW0764632.1 amino acid permease [Mammaliicoccus fleurettii]MEB6200691.1 amino acid permease [Mammaliicoccus fleurettii]MEB7723313.1 amino acid permease [Mammaliicoccus fleurettii]MEB7780164.1 amino acid permease [Mammaliicoccus fleurettii]